MKQNPLLYLMKKIKNSRAIRSILLVLAVALSLSVGGMGSEVSSSYSAGSETVYSESDSQITVSEKETQGKKKKQKTDSKTEELKVEEDKTYTSKEEVALYIHTYEHLPDNYITKNEAKELGWVSREGNLDEVAPGMSIGGDYFGNYEELLPKKKGRKYYECDIDYDGGYRNEKRIIFSNDGLIYYTEDHYESFEKLY